jgi:hypothetical protein
MEVKSGTHIFAVCLLILFCFSGSGFCAVFDVGGGDFYWCNPDNWDIGILPGPADSVAIGPVGDCVIIDCDVDIPSLNLLCDPYMCLTVLSGIVNISGIERNECEGDLYFNFLGGVTTIGGQVRLADNGWTHWTISGGTVILNDSVRAGDNDGTGWNLNMDSGVLVFADQVEIGDDGGGVWNISGTASVSFLNDLQPHLRDGSAVFELNLSGDAEMAVVGNIECHEKDNGDGTANINIDGGILNVGEVLYLGKGSGEGNLNVSGGLVVVGDTLKLNKGAANLTGGEVRAGDLEIDNGVMNIEPGGTLILDGNKLGQVVDLVAAGKLTGCGSPRGIFAEYGVANPGKTTVTSYCSWPPPQAWGPTPPDGATRVRSVVTEVVLEWIEGDYIGMMGRNSIYFGDNYDDVDDAIIGDPEWKGYQRSGINTYTVGNLPLWETFYWRIDQFNSVGGNPPVTKGQVWRFTTGCELIDGDINMDCLVNFLDFAELASTFGQEEFWPE